MRFARSLAQLLAATAAVPAASAAVPGVAREAVEPPRQQRGGNGAAIKEMSIPGFRLPRAIGAEDAEDLALAYMKVDSVDRTEPAEGLDQAGRVNGCCSCHDQNGRRPRLH